MGGDASPSPAIDPVRVSFIGGSLLRVVVTTVLPDGRRSRRRFFSLSVRQALVTFPGATGGVVDAIRRKSGRIPCFELPIFLSAHWQTGSHSVVVKHPVDVSVMQASPAGHPKLPVQALPPVLATQMICGKLPH